MSDMDKLYENDDPSLSSMVVFVAVSGTELGASLAGSLARQRARVALLTDTEVETDPEVTQIKTSFTSRESVATAFATAQQRLGRAQAVIHSGTPAASFKSAAIESLSYESWIETTHGAVKSTLYCLQAAHEQFDGRGGAILVFGPAIALVGVAGLVPLSTALEGQRALVKSAARQWGRKGIRINWLAIGPEGNYPALASAAVPEVPEFGPPPPALGRVPELARDAASLIRVLCSDVAWALTGATINLDGGNWMVP